MTSAVIRARRSEDLGPCVVLLRTVHERDHYPVRWPADPSGWLAPVDELASWVAERDGSVLGHVILRPVVGTDAAEPVAVATGVPVDRIALLARLFVAPNARRGGLARRLVDVVRAEALGRGLLLALDVVDDHGWAVAFYERLGWRRVATTRASWLSDNEAEQTPLHCYVAPGTADAT